uniref:Phospho-2-dehydro-3-deoxyheptonate aldolase n=1 Tax=Micromonospora sp. SCSIO 07395 TaxID=2998119 RepID=A0A9E9F194_9ACTN|nr:MichG [Micromonospora sp. SCSIO 07395]
MHTVRAATPRTTAYRHLSPPTALRAEIPLPTAAAETVATAREGISEILAGEDDRLVVVAGPCSIHDPEAALAYAEKLAALSRQVEDSVLVVMRTYVEKPRTRLGWKGLISDPLLNGSHDIEAGLRVARRTMIDVLGTGLPVGCEFLDPMVARYLSDLVAWGSIGARTVQSQIHRQLTSGLPMPVGIKNATGGGIEDAVDAIVAAGKGHVFPGISDEGVAAVLSTAGNPNCHLVLRGGADAPNYGPLHVSRALAQLTEARQHPSLFIDASHGNSGKDHRRQPRVVEEIAARIAEGEQGIAGVMIESFLAPGRQDLVLGRSDQLRYGQSITDACVGWEQTEELVTLLADTLRARRSAADLAMAG